MHYEEFEVITAANGAPSLKFDLACATARNHYIRCTKTQDKQGNDNYNSPCSTGLRVYGGAQVLAAFLARFGRDLLPHTAEHSTCGDANPWVVELGCGCGLVGFTATELFPEVSVMFTDASVDCLNLVAASARRHGLPMIQADANNFTGNLGTHMHRAVVSCPLEWRKEDTIQLISLIEQLSKSLRCQKNGGVRMVLGSDLLYYRVDIKLLLTTCKCLLQYSGDAACSGKDGGSLAPRLAILSHFMRIPDGYKKLQLAAYELGFGIVRVPIEAFIDVNVIQNRGWNGISIVMLFLRPFPHADSHSLEVSKSHRQREEADLAEIKGIFSEAHLPFQSEVLACYSKKSPGDALDDGVYSANGCELDTLPFRF
ncbi:methyltransferase [Trypanosoma conorhini]|uniref:Methyltransferase n=1 Tax=Trypanosoma conorhini TaxID=83891 RepID=A0A3R7LF89_9TRYP|nr:methyltransferase [Trypanosoma conorhini]RNE96104.1 methyltransferase [Trypanosoma conorhini]